MVEKVDVHADIEDSRLVIDTCPLREHTLQLCILLMRVLLGNAVLPTNPWASNPIYAALVNIFGNQFPATEPQQHLFEQTGQEPLHFDQNFLSQPPVQYSWFDNTANAGNTPFIEPHVAATKPIANDKTWDKALGHGQITQVEKISTTVSLKAGPAIIPPVSSKPLFTNWPGISGYQTTQNKQPLPSNNECVHEGKPYAPLTEIANGRSGDWCYGSYCNHEGVIIYWDDYNCKQRAKTQIVRTSNVNTAPVTSDNAPLYQQPASTGDGCWYNGAWYAAGSDMENSQLHNTCYGTYCDVGSKVVHWQDVCQVDMASMPMSPMSPPREIDCLTC